MRLRTFVLILALLWLVLAGGLACLPVDPLTRVLCAALAVVPLIGHLVFPYQQTPGARRGRPRQAQAARPAGPVLLPTDTRFTSAWAGQPAPVPSPVEAPESLTTAPSPWAPPAETPVADHTPSLQDAPRTAPETPAPRPDPRITRPLLLPGGLVPLPLEHLFRPRPQ